MSIRHAAQPQFPLRGLREGPAAPWVRPKDWPALPWIPENDQMLVGLIAVNDTTNEALAVYCEGAYTVDWGDGTAPQNATSGSQTQHNYTFATLTTPVTSRGYKTAIVKLYPQGGQNLTRIDLQRRPTGMGIQSPASPWLDIQVNAFLCTNLAIGKTATQSLSQVERVHIRNHAITDMTQQFYSMQSLASVPLFDTGLVTVVAQMFQDCPSLSQVPLFDFKNVTNAINLFNACRSLTTVPAFNLVKATDATNMFLDCLALYRVPDIIFGALLNATGMFNNCRSLRYIGALDLSLVTNYTNAFYYTSSISRMLMTGIKETINTGNGAMTAAALNELFGNLATVTGKTITVTNQPGAATCDQSIATAKGWTVVD